MPSDNDQIPFCDDGDPDGDRVFICRFAPGYGCPLSETDDCHIICPYGDALRSHPDYPNVTLAPSSAIAVVSLVSFGTGLARGKSDVLPAPDE